MKDIEIKSAVIKNFSLCRLNYVIFPEFILEVGGKEVKLSGTHTCEIHGLLDLMVFFKMFGCDTAKFAGKKVEVAIRGGIPFAISNTKDTWIEFIDRKCLEWTYKSFLKHVEILNS